jgi:hypothetical protein
MSEIKDRQDAASDIDPIVAAQADDMPNDTLAAASVEGNVADADMAIDAAEVPYGPPTEATVEAAAVATAVPVVTADASDPLVAEPVDAFGDTQHGEAVVDELASQAMPAELAADAGEVRPARRTFAETYVFSPLPETPMPRPVSLDQMAAAYADTVVEVEAVAHDADDDGPLLDGELEDGIASVFAALHAAAQDQPDDSEAIAPLGDLEAAEGVTFRLLGELDRLWHRAA